jgi:hypothetical protein
MSLVFVDSFDHYSSAQVGMKWDSVIGAVAISAGAGRRSTNGFDTTTAGTINITKNLSSVSCYIVGFAYKFSAVPATGRAILRFLDAGTNHIELFVSNTGVLQILRGGATLLSAYSTPLTAGTFYYIEMKGEISNSISAGGVEVKLDGVSVMTLAAGADSQNGASAQVNQIFLGTAGNAGVVMTFDDFYIINTEGAELSNYLGDVRIDVISANASGTVSNWSPSSAGAGMISMINQVIPDGGTTYMFASAASDAMRFTMSSLPSVVGSIYGIQLNLNIAKSDTTSAKTIAGLVWTGGTSTVGSTTTVPNTSYGYVTLITSADANAASWSSATIASTEFGIKIVA